MSLHSIPQTGCLSHRQGDAPLRGAAEKEVYARNDELIWELQRVLSHGGFPISGSIDRQDIVTSKYDRTAYSLTDFLAG